MCSHMQSLTSFCCFSFFIVLRHTVIYQLLSLFYWRRQPGAVECVLVSTLLGESIVFVTTAGDREDPLEVAEPLVFVLEVEDQIQLVPAQ